MLTDDERKTINHAADVLGPSLRDLATRLRAIAAPRVATVAEIEAAITAAAWTVAELDRRADVMAQPEIGALRTAVTSAIAAAREAGRREALEGAAGVEEAIADYTEAAIMARPHASGHVLTAAGDDLRAAIAADKAALDATWRAHDLERDAEVAQAQAATHEACAALQAICAALHVTPSTGSTYCAEAVAMVVERVAADKARAVEAASAGRHLCDLAGCDAPVTHIEKAAVVVDRDGATGRQDIWTCEEHADVGAVLLRPVLSAEDAARLVGDFNASPYDGSNDCPARAALLAALTGTGEIRRQMDAAAVEMCADCAALTGAGGGR